MHSKNAIKREEFDKEYILNSFQVTTNTASVVLETTQLTVLYSFSFSHTHTHHQPKNPRFIKFELNGMLTIPL